MTILSTPGAELLIVCAWCVGFDPADPRNATASHGICPTCVAKMAGEDPAKDAVTA